MKYMANLMPKSQNYLSFYYVYTLLIKPWSKTIKLMVGKN
ncbi:hypothetical protein ALTERO38_60295 [Alteromonas sp. 38]|nr:hypothetical protein ALTER154_40498 [Alteromonas sp. 154]VXC16615.1 hypothetical protein ALTERO38_60295 [Alteromonas sp. 38]